MACRTFFLCILLQFAGTPQVMSQFTTLEGRTFMVDGEAFYPRVMNYRIDLVSVQMSSADPMDLFVSPTGGNDANVHGHYECGTAAGCHLQLTEHFEKIVEMGFNTVRVGLGPYMRKNDQGDWFYSLGVRFNAHPLGTYGEYLLDLDIPDFSSDLSFHYFSLLRSVLDAAQDAGVMVILICADDAGGYNDPEQLTMAWNESAVHLYTDYLGRLAFELKDHPALLAYDLWNEPIWTSYDLLLWKKEEVCRFTAEWYDAIQEADGNHLVTLGGSGYNEVGSWDPAVMKLDFYSPHEYPEPSFLDGYDMVNAVERVKAQLYWQARTSPMPWLLGETGFSAEDDIIDPLDYYTEPDNQHLNGDPATHQMPWMHGSEAQQSDYAINTMDATRNYLGSGYSWWGFQNSRGGNLNSSPKAYLGNWFAPLKFGNEADPELPAPWNVTHRWRPKEMVAAIQAYTEPIAPAALPAPPVNYYNWQALSGPVYRTYGMHDQNNEPIADGLVTAEWFYGSLSLDPSKDQSLFDHVVTNNAGQAEMREPPLNVNTFFPREAQSLRFNASGAWRKSYEAGLWPTNGYSELLHRDRMHFSETIDGATVSVGTYEELEAWSELTVTNTVIEGSATLAGSANIRSRQWVHVEEEFHAQLGSEVHIYTDKTWPDCNSEGYASQFAQNPEQTAFQPGQKKRVELGLELRFQQPALMASAFPNPCSDQLTITINSNGGMCVLYDIYGQLVEQASFMSTNYVLSTSAFATGSYVLQVTTSLGVWTTTINKLP